jgi:biotin synthase
MDNRKLINEAKSSALAGKMLDRESIIALLSIDPETEDGELLGQAAREVASVVCKDRAYLWAAIGLDYRSLGESWGFVQDEVEYSEEEIMTRVKKFVDDRVRWIVLRTTQFYDLNKLIALGRKIKSTVAGDYELGVNVGEFDEEIAHRMVEAGFEFVYHSVRLREGTDTKFDPDERKATMNAVKNSPLKLVSLVEPIGVEHNGQEIADTFLTAMKYNAVVTGGMERVPVKGTPLGDFPAISEKRLAQIVAVTRLAAGFHAPDICVHRGSELAMKWGANVTVVETGAIPRDSCCSSQKEWNGFDASKATEWFQRQGYQVCIRDED